MAAQQQMRCWFRCKPIALLYVGQSRTINAANRGGEMIGLKGCASAPLSTSQTFASQTRRGGGQRKFNFVFLIMMWVLPGSVCGSLYTNEAMTD